MKIIIIANRLPVRIERKEETFSIERSEGGLATGLGSLETDAEKYWIGWPGIHTDDEKEKEIITHKLHELNFHPVFLS
ncbi:MAG: bifunctional alpha,alpha-trehalose-phosphate synthase (UDP-forming)/trehalose-phosphatase, partial [Bacteroidia bacterium]|nr:bifunctional alpha,alpha-trehalose-phosphate synthase (UDP-forming)/trehalose-phosphatase [Bacteroidia bacterium]